MIFGDINFGDCQTISRIVFLLFLVIASVYFMFVNKKPVKNIESFQQQATSPAAAPAPAVKTTAPAPAPISKAAPLPDKYDPDMYIDSKDEAVAIGIINDLYKNNFKKTASKTEVNFYMSYLETRKLTVADLNEVISGNTKKLDDTFYTGSTGNKPYDYNPLDPVLGTEDEVISIFNEILDRNPDSAELKYYAKKMSSDKTFTEEKLKQLLLASQEYKRLDNTQSNLANAGTLGGITDRQMTMTISNVFKEVNKTEVDDDTLKFLKRKFVEFELNEDTLRDYLKGFSTFQKDFEKNLQNAAPSGMSGFKKATPKSTSANSQSATKPGAGASANKKGSGAGDVSAEEFSEGDVGLNSGSKPNQELIRKLAKLYASDANANGEYLNSCKVIDTLLKDDQCDKNLDKDALEKRLEAMDKQLLAKLVYDRNMDHMKNVCRRNKKYLNADDDMVLFPEFKWSVPQQFPPVCTPIEKNEYQPMIDQSALIGTLLKDASKTKVGSILPETPPTN